MRRGRSSRDAARAVGALAALVVLVAAPAAASGAMPTGDDAFYRPPHPLSRGRPGDIIRSIPIDAPSGARAWKVLYHSRALDGRDIAVSGVVVAPNAPAPPGGRPIVSWAHATTGLSDKCAPSRDDAIGTSLPWEHEFLARGSVIAATDYEGLGTPGPHPYLVGESEGRGVLDVARAARRLRGAGAGSRVVAVGQSQGGQAALFAGQLASTYAPELRVEGVAAIAPVTDVSLMFAADATAAAVRGFVAMAAEGIRAAYPRADVDAVLAPGVPAALRSFDGVACLLTTLVGFGQRSAPVLRRDPDAVPSVRDALRRSTAGNVATRIPVLVLQGDQDALVPEPMTRAFVQRACALRDRLAYDVYPGADHTTVLAAATRDLLEWLDERVAGVASLSTCSA